MTAPEYSVVVPVFESRDSIRLLVERLERMFVTDLSATFEVILVDDGSRSPATWATCEELAAARSWVRAIRLTRNFGKPSAVLCGLARAKGRWIVTIDDDLQQRPEDIPALAACREHDVVVAVYPRRRHGVGVRLASWIKSHFDRWILGLPCKMSPLKLIRAEVARAMLDVHATHPFIPALLAHVTSDFHPVRLDHAASVHGASRYTLRRRLRQFSNLVISNSSFLLRMIGGVGVGLSLGGFVFAAWVVVRKTLGGAPLLPGWASLVVINLVFGGLTLVALSIVGEYLIRIVDGVSHKPPFVVRSDTGADPPATGPQP